MKSASKTVHISIHVRVQVDQLSARPIIPHFSANRKWCFSIRLLLNSFQNVLLWL